MDYSCSPKFWDDCSLRTDGRTQICAQRAGRWDSTSSTKMLLPKRSPFSSSQSVRLTLAFACPTRVWNVVHSVSADKFQRGQRIGWSSAMDHAQGNHLTHNGKAPEEDKMQGGGKHLPRLPALVWKECFPSFCQLQSFMLTLHILYCRSTPMLPLAQLNYLLRHSGGNRTAGSADVKAPFQCLMHSATGHITSASGLVCGPPSSHAVLDLTFC